MHIFATEQLSPRQSLTPEGYLLCEAVPIARTGSQLYAAHELPFLEAGVDGLITVIREESEVFRPETMASFEGKSVTIRHSFVDPDSWGRLTKGTVQNVRRDDVESDLLLADLLITDADAIEKVRVPTDDNGRPLPGQEALREVSCGYEADYVQERPGVAFQRNIVGNHVALVERGRAGPRCSIQDGEIEMANKTPATLVQRLLKAIKVGDSALLKRTADEAEAEMAAEEKKAADEEAEAEKKETADQIATLSRTVDALAKTFDAFIKAAKTGDEDDGDDEKKETEDEDEATEAEKKETADAMRDTVTRAEMLVPGFTLPTTDSVTTRDGVAVVQRKVLADAMKTEDGKAILTPLLGGRTLDAVTGDNLGTMFVAASEMARTRNNARGARHGVQTKDFGKAPRTIAEINEANGIFWKNRS